MLEQQRAALLMLISALTLVPEQQLLMPRASRLSFGAESPDLDSVQQWFQERFRVQRTSKVLSGVSEAFRIFIEPCRW